MDLLAIARQTGAPIPLEPESDPQSSRPPSVSLPAAGIEAWQKRTALLEQMLARAFDAGAPAEMTRTLAEVKSHVRRLAELRSRSMTAQRSLEQIEQRGRDGRQRFGFAVQELAVDASKAKEAARAAKATAQPLEEKSKQLAATYAAVHKELMYWEGRAGFQEPSKDLADAYRAASKVVENWLAARVEERKVIAEGAAAARAVSDLEFQIAELRGALQNHEQAIELEQQKCELAIGEGGKIADILETELATLMARFCEPLRPRPELVPLFKELEGVAA
jgi:hypothetical protein